MEKINIQLASPLFNRLHLLAVEYSVSIDVLINAAVKKMVDDVDLIRDLRAGKIKPEYDPTYPYDQCG
jgi:hypothetical protein